MKQIDNLILCMTKEKPLERIRALEQKINEVEKSAILKTSLIRLKRTMVNKRSSIIIGSLCFSGYL